MATTEGSIVSAYTDSVERSLKGLKAVSTGPCPGCAECASAYGFRDYEDDDGNVILTAQQRFDEAYESGSICTEGSFSWGSCDICGSTFGGDREEWHALMDGKLQHFDNACTDCVVYLANGDEPEDWYRSPQARRDAEREAREAEYERDHPRGSACSPSCGYCGACN